MQPAKPLLLVGASPKVVLKLGSLWKIYHTVNRLRSFLSLGHSVTWSLGHSVTRSLDHSVTRSLSHSVTRSLGHLVTWSLGHLVSFFQHYYGLINWLTDWRTTSGSTVYRSASQTIINDTLFTVCHCLGLKIIYFTKFQHMSLHVIFPCEHFTTFSTWKISDPEMNI